MASAVVAFEGYVCAPVPADGGLNESSGLTVRIGGEDVLAGVLDAALDLVPPIQAQIHLGFGRPIVGHLGISRGGQVSRCCDRCCGPDAPEDCDPERDHIEDAAFDVVTQDGSHVDMLEELEKIIGDQTRMDVALIGASA